MTASHYDVAVPVVSIISVVILFGAVENRRVAGLIAGAVT